MKCVMHMSECQRPCGENVSSWAEVIDFNETNSDDLGLDIDQVLLKLCVCYLHKIREGSGQLP